MLLLRKLANTAVMNHLEKFVILNMTKFRNSQIEIPNGATAQEGEVRGGILRKVTRGDKGEGPWF